MNWLELNSPPAIMGILNVTPDSFSDGGRFVLLENAVDQAKLMVEEGADIIDVGGESTRPGSVRQPASVQVARVLPVIDRLRYELSPSIAISIDTSLAEVAAAALDAGADMVNDVSAGRDSEDMLPLVAQRGVPIVLMHIQGDTLTMHEKPEYISVCAEVQTFLSHRITIAEAAGVAREQILIDPGIGFGKGREDNLDLLNGLDELVALGFPVVLGASRKRFMGSLCSETKPEELLGATLATTAMGTLAGVRVFRVHDVKANRQAADVVWALCRRR